jgi:geranylgeranyl pyrophosphate synthase
MAKDVATRRRTKEAGVAKWGRPVAIAAAFGLLTDASATGLE